jgi:putative ABC transport system substrate-binding protein
MNKRVLSLLAVIFLTSGHLAEAQEAKKIPRIGYLTGASASTISSRIEAFRQGLRELGYVEGKNIVIEYRYAEGKVDTSLLSRPNWCVSR